MSDRSEVLASMSQQVQEYKARAEVAEAEVARLREALERVVAIYGSHIAWVALIGQDGECQYCRGEGCEACSAAALTTPGEPTHHHCADHPCPVPGCTTPGEPE